MDRKLLDFVSFSVYNRAIRNSLYRDIRDEEDTDSIGIDRNPAILPQRPLQMKNGWPATLPRSRTMAAAFGPLTTASRTPRLKTFGIGMKLCAAEIR